MGSGVRRRGRKRRSIGPRAGRGKGGALGEGAVFHSIDDWGDVGIGFYHRGVQLLLELAHFLGKFLGFLLEGGIGLEGGGTCPRSNAASLEE